MLFFIIFFLKVKNALKLLCCLSIAGVLFINETNAAQAQCEGSTIRPENLPPDQRQVQYIPSENKLRIRVTVVIKHKDGHTEMKQVDTQPPFKWSDWLEKGGYTLSTAVALATQQELQGIMNQMCKNHGCYKN